MNRSLPAQISKVSERDQGLLQGDPRARLSCAGALASGAFGAADGTANDGAAPVASTDTASSASPAAAAEQPGAALCAAIAALRVVAVMAREGSKPRRCFHALAYTLLLCTSLSASGYTPIRMH